VGAGHLGKNGGMTLSPLVVALVIAFLAIVVYKVLFAG
jgi:hypothetical protein